MWKGLKEHIVVVIKKFEVYFTFFVLITFKLKFKFMMLFLHIVVSFFNGVLASNPPLPVLFFFAKKKKFMMLFSLLCIMNS